MSVQEHKAQTRSERLITAIDALTYELRKMGVRMESRSEAQSGHSFPTRYDYWAGYPDIYDADGNSIGVSGTVGIQG